MPLPLPWIPKVLAALPDAVRDAPDWATRVAAALTDPRSEASIHLAIFVEPFLGYVLDGSKSVESRFSVHRVAPYRQVRSGDIVLLKATSGPVVGICTVSEVWDYHLDPNSWSHIREAFTARLRAEDPSFWESRKGAAYATLMQVEAARPLAPIPCDKRDRRGWVVLHTVPRQLEANLQ